MSFTQFSNRDAREERSPAKSRATSRAIGRDWGIDKVTVLALLAASAIFAPVAVAIMHQAAKIFAH